jgi:hypothetical protein
MALHQRGGVEAAIGVVRSAPALERRQALSLARVRALAVAGLVQLAADIVHTTVTPGWEEIGRVATIAAIARSSPFSGSRYRAGARRTDDDNASVPDGISLVSLDSSSRCSS